MPRGIAKIFLFLLPLMVSTMLLLGCTEERIEKVNQTTATPKNLSEIILNIGETAKSSRLEVTVKEIFKTNLIGWESEFGGCNNYYAEEGNVLIFAFVRIKNIAKESKEWYVGPADFSLTDENGKRYDVKYLSLKDSLEGGELYPGEYREGWIVFEVPENISEVMIRFDFGDIFESKVATWKTSMDKIPEKEVKLEIVNGTAYYEYGGLGDYTIKKINITIRNTGSAPFCYWTLEANYEKNEWSYVSSIEELINPKGEKTFSLDEMYILFSKPEEIKVRIVYNEEILAEGVIGAEEISSS